MLKELEGKMRERAMQETDGGYEGELKIRKNEKSTDLVTEMTNIKEHVLRFISLTQTSTSIHNHQFIIETQCTPTDYLTFPYRCSRYSCANYG